MSNLRIFWIAWCVMWALFWLILGFFTIIGWVGVPFSLLSILIPVGQAEGPTVVQQNAYWPPPAAAPPGWYPDPWNQSLMRWWDGRVWTNHADQGPPLQGMPPPPPPPPPQ